MKKLGLIIAVITILFAISMYNLVQAADPIPEISLKYSSSSWEGDQYQITIASQGNFESEYSNFRTKESHKINGMLSDKEINQFASLVINSGFFNLKNDWEKDCLDSDSLSLEITIDGKTNKINIMGGYCSNETVRLILTNLEALEEEFKIK